MEPGINDERESALRPLRNVRGVVASLRGGSLPAGEQRSAVIQIASAAESSLRRLLRDHPGVALPVRLRALAPDELRADEVLAELRQHDRISIELAAAVHDLLEVRSELKDGAPLAPDDLSLACLVADRLEREVTEPYRQPPPSTLEAPVDETVALPVPPASEVTDAQRRRWYAIAGVAVLTLLLAGLGFWFARPSGSDEMEQGMALFRTGAYADAAAHFYRYAEAHPDEATPHLYLARIHRRMKRLDLAVPELRKALELAPDDPAIQTEFGLLLTDTGQYDVAIRRFRTALEQDPDSELAWIGLVRALRASGRADAVPRVLQQAPPEVRALLSGRSPAADSIPL